MKNDFVKYLIIGFINTAIGYSIILLLIYLGLIVELSNLLGYILVWFFSYFMNKGYTFKYSGQSNKTFSKYIVSMLISYTINLVILVICFRYFHINAYISQIFASFFYTLIGYILLKKWVFHL